jgi:DNA-binding MarR family transcriptional regulator
VSKFQPPKLSRAELLAALTTAGRETSTAAVMFHTTLAALQGLSATETKAIDVLDRHGALTAGELAARTGLAPPSITGLVNRLERKGYVRRVADPSDGRRVRIERTPEALAAMAPLFADFGRRIDALYATFTDDELAIILRFMTGITEQQRQATARLLKMSPTNVGSEAIGKPTT